MSLTLAAGINLRDGEIYTIHISNGSDSDETPVSSYCIDLDSGSSTNGTSCQSWDYTGAGQPKNLQWKAHGPERIDGQEFWRFENVASGTYMDMEPVKNWGKPKVYGWGYSYGSDAQRWEVIPRETRTFQKNLKDVEVPDAGARIRNKGRDQWMAYGAGIPGVFMGLHNGADIIGINGLVEKHYFYFLNVDQNKRNILPPRGQ